MNSSLNYKSVCQEYIGKVRNVYKHENNIFIIASNRISAFDHILPREIPYKGAVLNKLSTFFLEKSKHLVPNWLEATPHANLAIGQNCELIPIEVIIRGYITGSMWRAYEAGQTEFCGHHLPEGLKRNQKLEHPIITPTTKAVEGHDEDTSEEAILQSGVVSQKDWETIKTYAFKIYEFGTEYAATKDLILVDTKLEFGRNKQGEIMLIDEILTPDSSRYFIKSSYAENFEKGEEPKQLSKEFVRQWLIEQGFMGRDGDQMPEMPDEFVNEISEKYIDLYQKLTGEIFDKAHNGWNQDKIDNEINEFISKK